MDALTDSKPLLLSSSAKQLTDNQQKSTTKQRYIILHPKNVSIPNLSANSYSRTLNTHQVITFTDLTAAQATAIEKLIAPANGKIHLNIEHKRDTHTVTPVTVANQEIVAESSTPYANAPVTCSTISISSDFVLFFPDSMVDASQFPKVNLSIGTNYSGNPTPCDPHANYTLAIFEQVLGDQKLSVTNIPVFTCGDTVTDEAAINALQDILDYKNANPTKKVGMYFAVNPFPADTTLTNVTQELVNAGVLVVLAAGNQGYDVCNYNWPPQNVAGTLQIGSTVPPGNQCDWWTNWSDITPNTQYGDCVAGYLPGEFTINKFKVKVTGTSFSAPQGAALAMRYWSKNPNATTTQIINAFKNHLVVIKKQGNQNHPPMTSTGQMRVIKTANYCSINSSTSKPKP
jgi:hypothetical protein